MKFHKTTCSLQPDKIYNGLADLDSRVKGNIKM